HRGHEHRAARGGKPAAPHLRQARPGRQRAPNFGQARSAGSQQIISGDLDPKTGSETLAPGQAGRGWAHLWDCGVLAARPQGPVMWSVVGFTATRKSRALETVPMRSALALFALLAIGAGLPAAAQTIYPIARAEILAGARFDFKVEFPGSVAAGDIKVTVN